MISIDAARDFLDFAGGSDGRKPRLTQRAAEDQLQGAVALHNILEQRGFAYLADEVGLGKTYVALGVFALFRHFDPNFRLLVIAPKENIQRKWIKELHNFVRNNVRFPDMRVKALHGAPARPPIYCKNFAEFMHQTAVDPDRDFFIRLTSFGIGLSEEASESWIRKRNAIKEALPWYPGELLSLRSKEEFKLNYARAVCCAIPEFDLVIFDEGHNLKAGLHKSAALRNRLVAMTLGNDVAPLPASDSRRVKHFGPRAKRVLFLSATPLEDDYRHIWNQLDVFGLGEKAPDLKDPAVPEDQKRKLVSQFLIRRVSSMNVGGADLTKNLYRRQWREGGVEKHDLPLPTPTDRQRLIVALVQKKVSEILSNEQFNHSFQIGMLASFESFFQTAEVRTDSDDQTFDDADQTQDLLERQGVDVHTVNRIGRDYEKKFEHPMPHPKMDALVANLRGAFDSGRKALVFVRRVASVKEIEHKLESEYDEWLFWRLRNELRPEVQKKLEELIRDYKTEKLRRKPAAVQIEDLAPEIEEVIEPVDDSGGIETFFAWFFRGEERKGILTGATIAKRFTQARFALSSLFSENYAARLLDVAPGAVFQKLQDRVGWPAARLQSELERRAGRLIDRRRNPARTTPHLVNFLAFQQAAVEILSENGHSQADVVLQQVLNREDVGGESVSMEDWLERSTFFTALREHPVLRHEIWPIEVGNDAIAAFRREELRRELIGSMFRLGHAYINLYAIIVNRLGTLSTGGEDLDNKEVADDLVALLERQRNSTEFRAYRELKEASANFDLILDTNLPNLWEVSLEDASREIGGALRAQQPVGGMFGEVNRTLVRQFRMPGYPFVLVTTDLLQEGEDLHIFCSDVYHYGISWMPSSMEQRIGRIDRVRSQTERRLTELSGGPTGDDLLQVYFPYLRETVEVYQVNRVLERLDRFIELMHENFGAKDEDRDKRINLLREIQQETRATSSNDQPLKSSFPVRPELLKGNVRRLAIRRDLHDDLLSHFYVLTDRMAARGVVWDGKAQKISRAGHIQVGQRVQPFTLFLHSIGGRAHIRCVSPIGHIDVVQISDRITDLAKRERVRICAVVDPKFEDYRLTAESDVLLSLDSEIDLARLEWLVMTTATSADRLEEAILNIDQDIARFRDDLGQEVTVER